MLKEKIIETLQWYESIGVDEALDDHPAKKMTSLDDLLDKVHADALSHDEHQKQSETKSLFKKEKRPHQKVSTSAPLGAATATAEAKELAAKCETLDELKQAIIAFEGCTLKHTATNIVYGDGNPESGILLIGEAPGNEEDRSGVPFSGASGQLNDEMLKYIGLTSREQFYIINSLPWRPPGNRAPNASELAMMEPFLIRHIQLVNPKVILFVGGVSAKLCLGEKDGITKLRGKWYDYKIEGIDEAIPARPVLHPAFLLRQPSKKKVAWQDLIEVRHKLQALGVL